MMKDINSNEIIAPLRWACRRGMLELDLILGPFLNACFLTLAPTEQTLFKALLTCSDQDLFAWLFNNQMPSEPQFLPLIQKIQVYAHASIAAQTG